MKLPGGVEIAHHLRSRAAHLGMYGVGVSDRNEWVAPTVLAAVRLFDLMGVPEFVLVLHGHKQPAARTATHRQRWAGARPC